ncbi:MAG: M48 family metalloprotease [Vicingaceae bacterium]
MKFAAKLIGSLGVILFLSNSCNKKENDESFNIFTVNQDIALGQQLVDYLESDSSDIDVLDPAAYPEAYGHMERIRNKILNSGEVYYKDRFDWRIRIIRDDETLNAFCAPGGFIYVYTGIIKYLDNEYELAGVLGHEIAHADKRHSTSQMTKQYGISILLAAVGGDQSIIGTLAANLALLKYGRNDESQADQFSVEYLCPTTYKADGAAQFFRKIGSSPVPEFLSTHPDPKDRVNDIESYAAGKNCTGTETLGQYVAFKASLP